MTTTILHKQFLPHPDAIVRILAHHTPRSRYVDVVITGPQTTSPEQHLKILLKNFPQHLKRWKREGYIDVIQMETEK